MSYKQSFVSRHLGIIISIIAIGLFAIGFGIIVHDSTIVREKIETEIFGTLSCDKLIWEKQWEDKMIWKDETKLKIIETFSKEKRCSN